MITNKNLKLLLHIIFAVAVGLVLLALAWYVLGEFGGLGDSPAGVATSAITTVGGLVGIALLVVNYHKQITSEETLELAQDKQVEEKLTQAIILLGDEEPSTRIAGVYALTEFADQHPETHKQRVVNILCGYLRTKRENDGPVESTILDEFRRHLLDPEHTDNSAPSATSNNPVRPDINWHDTEINLKDAVLTEQIPFVSCTISALNCENTQFDGVAWFKDAQFTGVAWFKGAKFHGGAMFEGAKFHRDVWFQETQFTGDVWFRGAQFGDAWFQETQFTGETGVEGTQFTGVAWFKDAQFKGDAWFEGAKFHHDAFFQVTQFHGDAWFEGAKFHHDAFFQVTQFHGDAKFRGAKFHHDAGFEDAQFGDAWFQNTQFTGDAGFRGTQFHGDAWFKDAQFNSQPVFTDARFKARKNFSGCRLRNPKTKEKEYEPFSPNFD